MAKTCSSCGGKISWAQRQVTPLYCSACVADRNATKIEERQAQAEQRRIQRMNPTTGRDLVQADGSLKCPQCGSSQFETKISTGPEGEVRRRSDIRIGRPGPVCCMRREVQASLSLAAAGRRRPRVTPGSPDLGRRGEAPESRLLEAPGTRGSVLLFPLACTAGTPGGLEVPSSNLGAPTESPASAGLSCF